MTGRHRIGVLVFASVAATAVLHAAGSGALAPPPVGSWPDLEAWYAERGPATAMVVLVRLLGIGAGGWLALTGVLQLAVPRVGREGFSKLVAAISPELLRALTAGTAGLSVTAGLALPALPSEPPENPSGTAVMVPLDVPATPRTSSTSTSTTAVPAVVPPSAAPAPAAPVTPVPDAPPAVYRADEVVVASGDSFWSIAVEEAGERNLDGYWRAVIDLNRDRLVDPSNPDLLYPGQVLRLP